MSDRAVLALRLTPEEREELQAAAAKAGRARWGFIRDTVMAAARRVNRLGWTPPPAPDGDRPPAWFTRSCDDARVGGIFGFGDAGYALGLHLAAVLGSEPPGVLLEALQGDDRQAAWRELKRHFLWIQPLVPCRHHRTFLEGVGEAIAGVDLQTAGS